MIEFLKSNGKKFHNVWLRKKKDLLRLLMLVVVEAICDTKERFSRCVIYNFIKKIHIVEHKPVQKGKNIILLAFS